MSLGTLYQIFKRGSLNFNTLLGDSLWLLSLVASNIVITRKSAVREGEGGGGRTGVNYRGRASVLVFEYNRKKNELLLFLRKIFK